ncbi:MAG: homoserine dehydrogenase [Spirochaetota bacterium]|nr:MAG: homoserine dehydrogenase [Spirochaetota bacterium]
MRSINIGIIGAGTVGSGVWELFSLNKDLIENKSGMVIKIMRIADKDNKKKKTLGIPDRVFTNSAEDVISDPDVDIVVELIGGTTDARECIIKAASNGKHIVTANKALLAKHGIEILTSVMKNEVELGFEASVGGGIPIIKTINEALIGNRITRLIGILNGTSNFILTKMTREKLGFTQALKIAQEMGFAEADPTLDISGGDARHKITILSSLAFNTMIDHDKVYMEGIDKIDIKDIQYAEEFGFVTKLLAVAELLDAGILVRVHPTLVSRDNPLAAVMWEDNAVMVHSDFLGKSMYYGKGAGAKPTASAVVADILDIAQRVINRAEYNKNRYTFFKDLPQIGFSANRTRYYFRFNVLDRPGILSRISGVLGDNNISIASVIQKETEEQYEHVPLVMLTHEAVEADVQNAISKINTFDEVEGKGIIIRVMEE